MPTSLLPLLLLTSQILVFTEFAVVAGGHQSSLPSSPSSLDEFDRHRLHRIKLFETQYFETDPEALAAAGAQCIRMGSPIYNMDRAFHIAISASMITVQSPSPTKATRARPWVNNATDSHILGVWLMLKVVEVRVPVTPMACLSNWMINQFRASPSLERKMARECVRINPDSVVKYESLEPRQHLITMHGRIVKLYSAFEPDQPATTTTGGGHSSTPMDMDIQWRKTTTTEPPGSSH
ncbi:hypothetical protein BGZ47_008757 [Haplosporangium gracile]|nr:hypothetical protein BGZ47_008757 [Haplosporangium gracile]